MGPIGNGRTPLCQSFFIDCLSQMLDNLWISFAIFECFPQINPHCPPLNRLTDTVNLKRLPFSTYVSVIGFVIFDLIKNGALSDVYVIALERADDAVLQHHHPALHFPASYDPREQIRNFKTPPLFLCGHSCVRSNMHPPLVVWCRGSHTVSDR